MPANTILTAMLDRPASPPKTPKCKPSIDEQSSIRYTAARNEQVWDLRWLVPTALELHIRRLKWYQMMAKDTSLHSAVVASLFGQLQCAENPTIGPHKTSSQTANPWAKQLFHDADALDGCDDG